jgi:hypothetical protein
MPPLKPTAARRKKRKKLSTSNKTPKYRNGYVGYYKKSKNETWYS